MARDALTFQEVAATNRKRCERWHSEGEAWTGADWSNAMCGEAGEAANIVKKLRRIETFTIQRRNQAPREQLVHDLGHELADTLLYAFLLADHYGIDVAEALADKFDLVSEANGFPERLGS